MQLKKPYIIFLAVFQLIVFTSPHFIKSFHHHSLVHFPVKNNSTELGIAEKPCLICQFEFVTFELNKPVKYTFCLPSVPLQNSETIAQVYYSSFYYYSHRAPPVI